MPTRRYSNSKMEHGSGAGAAQLVGETTVYSFIGLNDGKVVHHAVRDDETAFRGGENKRQKRKREVVLIPRRSVFVHQLTDCRSRKICIVQQTGSETNRRVAPSYRSCSFVPMESGASTQNMGRNPDFQILDFLMSQSRWCNCCVEK